MSSPPQVTKKQPTASPSEQAPESPNENPPPSPAVPTNVESDFDALQRQVDWQLADLESQEPTQPSPTSRHAASDFATDNDNDNDEDSGRGGSASEGNRLTEEETDIEEDSVANTIEAFQLQEIEAAEAAAVAAVATTFTADDTVEEADEEVNPAEVLEAEEVEDEDDVVVDDDEDEEEEDSSGSSSSDLELTIHGSPVDQAAAAAAAAVVTSTTATAATASATVTAVFPPWQQRHRHQQQAYRYRAHAPMPTTPTLWPASTGRRWHRLFQRGAHRRQSYPRLPSQPATRNGRQLIARRHSVCGVTVNVASPAAATVEASPMTRSMPPVNGGVGFSTMPANPTAAGERNSIPLGIGISLLQRQRQRQRQRQQQQQRLQQQRQQHRASMSGSRSNNEAATVYLLPRELFEGRFIAECRLADQGTAASAGASTNDDFLASTLEQRMTDWAVLRWRNST